MSRRGLSLGLGSVLLVAGCGSGGGGSFVSENALGPTDWAIPLVGSTGGRSTWVTFHNLDREPTAVGYDAYAEDGTYVTGAIAQPIDGFASRHFQFSSLSGISWVHAYTPSRLVDVGFSTVDDSIDDEESARAWPLVDLAAPPAGTQRASVFVTPPTRRVQLVNASTLASLVTITRFEEPADPLLPPTEIASGSILLGARESYTYDPDTLFPGFVGKILYESPDPIFAATEDLLSFGGERYVRREDRTLHADVRFGVDSTTPLGLIDWVWLLRNDSSDAQSVVLQDVRVADGAPLLFAPRVVTLAPKESRAISTLDSPFADIFGDVRLAPGILRARFEALVPERVAASVQHFDPDFEDDRATAPMQPSGHVIDSYLVFPSEFLDAFARTFYTVQNPSPEPIQVVVSSVVTEPTGFDASVLPLTTLTIPARGFSEFSPDGTVYRDRDLVPTVAIALRFFSPSSFAVTGRRETRDETELLIAVTPTIIRVHDDAR